MNNFVDIVEPDTVITNSTFGSPVWNNELSNMLNPLDGCEHESDVILLCYINQNLIKAATLFGIDELHFGKHKDPYTGYEVYSIVPVAVLTDNTEKYTNNLKIPDCVLFAFDSQCIKLAFGPIKEQDKLIHPMFSITLVGSHLMGTGYTSYCSMYDGSRECMPAKMKLSNGDWLFVWFWNWYNK